MKSKYWIALFGAVLFVCAALSVWFLLPRGAAQYAEVWSEGKLVETVNLSADKTLTVESEFGVNVVTVKDGKIAVTKADCPDHYCMDRGYCHSGAQIVCLPNRLVIKFTGKQNLDSVAG